MFDPPGAPVEPEGLQTALGRSLAGVLRAQVLPFVTLREVRRDAGADVVVVDVVPELPQDPVVDIRRPEPIAIRLRDEEDRTPEVLALREDFPSDHFHLNVTEADCPWPSLCLYEDRWSDLRLHLTPASLLSRVQDWLSRSARGDLHDPDQPLEPFVTPLAFPLVLPPTLETGESSGPLAITSKGKDEHTVLVASHVEVPGDADHLAFAFHTGPAKQAALRRHPADLHGLHELLEPLEFDLVGTLRKMLRELKDENTDFEKSPAARSRPVLVFVVPLIRVDGDAPEGEQVFSYYVNVPILALGEALGIWASGPDGVGLLLPVDDAARGQDVGLIPLRPVFDITPEDARAISGIEGGDLCLAVVGVGALGSQIVMNLVRSGYGRWSLIDDDSLLPHNLVRHVLPRTAIGFPKAEAMAFFTGSVACEAPQARGLVGNVLADGRDGEIVDALRTADLVLDLSASATVARALARDLEELPRCLCLFLNPTGTDLVALLEDGERRIRLDALEMQYYRALTREPQLEGHLNDPTSRVRYGTSCRDITVKIPQDQVAVAAGIGARVVRTSTEGSEATLRVWRMDSDLSVSTVSVEVPAILEWESDEWSVVSDKWLLQHLADARCRRLPSETGGVLLGFHDVQRKRLYLADALPAPPDSTERPVFFDRGCIGLREAVADVERRTAGALSYVGEWHSHPSRSTAPSKQDSQVLQYLKTHMVQDGLPALMVIVGEAGIAIYVDSLRPCRPK